MYEVIRGGLNPVLRHIREKLWRNPALERQFQLELTKVNDQYGNVDVFSYLGRMMFLPTKSHFYEVFSLGGLHLDHWNLRIPKGFISTNMWVNLADLSVRRGMVALVYNDYGLSYPRDLVWIQVRDDGVGLCAIRKSDWFTFSPEDKLYLRCYTPDDNYTTFTDELSGKDEDGNELEDEANPPEHRFYIESLYFQGEDKLKLLKKKYEELQSYGIGAYLHVNGEFTRTFPGPTDLERNSYIEIIYDPSIEKIMIFDIRTLPEFTSTLDNEHKYIVHPPKDDNWMRTVCFEDCEFYLTNSAGRGLYYHRNQANNIRQLTMRDYSISDNQLQYISENFNVVNQYLNNKLVVIYRKNAWELPYPDDNNRINYLYRMTDKQILQAMTGVNSTVPEWTAAELEASNQMFLMRAKPPQITIERSIDALGYRALTKLIHDRLLVKEDIRYEVDSYLGHLYVSTQLGKIRFNDVKLSATIDTVARYPESYPCISYKVNKDADDKYVDFLEAHTSDEGDYTIPETGGYQILLATVDLDRNITGVAKDVTGDTSYYSVEDGVIKWKQLGSIYLGLILDPFSGTYRESQEPLVYNFSLALSVQLRTRIKYNGKYGYLNMMGTNHSLFLNDKLLIEGIDFNIHEDYIKVVNKMHMNLVTKQNTLRLFSNGKLKQIVGKLNPDRELGYITHGVIGAGPLYHVRDDRPLIMNIGGVLYDPTTIKDSERYKGDTDYTHPLNGLPYEVVHDFVPLPYINQDDVYYQYDKARDLDLRISHYLTEKIGKEVFTNPSTISKDKYLLFSPFMAAVTYLITENMVVPKALEEGEVYANQYIADLFKDYLHILEWDPIMLGYDENYIQVHPFLVESPVVLTVDQFKLVKQINTLYLKSKLDIESHYEVSTDV